MAKILLINDHSGFSGGGDAALYLEKQALEEAGYEVYVLAFDKEANEHQRVISYVEHRSRIVNKVRKFLGSNNISEFIRKKLEFIKPDVIHCHLISKYPIDVYESISKYRVITTLHGPNFFCATSWGGLMNGAPCEQGIGLKCFRRGCTSLVNASLYTYLTNKLWNNLKSNTSIFHCPSRNIYSVAHRLGLENLTYKPLGIDSAFEKPVIKPLSSRPILLYVGAISEVKGIKVLFKSLLEIKKVFPNFLLKVAGKGILLDWCKNFVIEYDLQDNVEFLGFVDRHTVKELYIEANVFLMPSIWQEQFGLVGVEALACKTPCVATNVGGIPEWLQHGQSGYLVPPHAVNELADATIKLLRSSTMRQNFGEYGRSFVLEHYGASKYKSNMLELVEKLLKSDE
ncbi:glycosyltransferase family 4 protein [Thalassotalea mangrovi]|uniref:Glycosyltransferase family 4 protein n=1 Tax=Thalassotalea mangrovi TaxID=2572245 RepID=A0A4U1B6H5_9GAMM|nr:glycosyltransferase family 4 protein [Thalassotalea mangrovi]TKB46144.1 glycosyltransferase family 4 protein [Thalassotalea mangrovi]